MESRYDVALIINWGWLPRLTWLSQLVPRHQSLASAFVSDIKLKTTCFNSPSMFLPLGLPNEKLPCHLGGLCLLGLAMRLLRVRRRCYGILGTRLCARWKSLYVCFLLLVDGQCVCRISDFDLFATYRGLGWIPIEGQPLVQGNYGKILFRAV
jgi:hypothetical protein